MSSSRNVIGFLLALIGAYLFVLGTGGVELPGLNIELSGTGQALALLVGLVLAIIDIHINMLR